MGIGCLRTAVQGHTHTHSLFRRAKPGVCIALLPPSHTTHWAPTVCCSTQRCCTDKQTHTALIHTHTHSLKCIHTDVSVALLFRIIQRASLSVTVCYQRCYYKYECLFRCHFTRLLPNHLTSTQIHISLRGHLGSLLDSTVFKRGEEGAQAARENSLELRGPGRERRKGGMEEVMRCGVGEKANVPFCISLRIIYIFGRVGNGHMAFSLYLHVSDSLCVLLSLSVSNSFSLPDHTHTHIHKQNTKTQIAAPPLRHLTALTHLRAICCAQPITAHSALGIPITPVTMRSYG